jgi:transposase
LYLLGLSATSSTITAVVCTTAEQAPCPGREQASTHVQSRYVRRPADLPWHGVAMRLELHVRRFSCPNANCGRQIFTERLPGVVAPYARRTEHTCPVVALARA